MAYIDEGEGAPIVFAHGNPTSSYLWRNVMPACRGLGRLIACDMIGMGDSEKLPDSGPDRYTYAEQRSFLFALWKKLGVDKDVVFVLHDWGSLLGFDWTRQHPSASRVSPTWRRLFSPLPGRIGLKMCDPSSRDFAATMARHWCSRRICSLKTSCRSDIAQVERR